MLCMIVCVFCFAWHPLLGPECRPRDRSKALYKEFLVLFRTEQSVHRKVPRSTLGEQTLTTPARDTGRPR